MYLMATYPVLIAIRQMDSDATRFHTFQATIQRPHNGPRLAGPEIPENQTNSRDLETPELERSNKSKAKKNLNSDKVMSDLLDIGEDIEDLRQIKDIRDELNMMDSLFRIQDGVMQAMKQVIEGGESWNEGKNTSREGPNHLHASLYPPLEVVKRNLEEVERLDHFARKAGEAVRQPYHSR